MKSFLKRIFFPILSSFYKYYSSKKRSYTYKNITINVLPGVFHPGLFFSTKLLIEYLMPFGLTGKKVLELGAGSGLISIYCAKKYAITTASDINPTAIKNIEINAQANNVQVKTVESDLFDNIAIRNFDYIVINPPYFPKNPKTEKEYAWFCGSDFEYFKKLFNQLKDFKTEKTIVLMILSEDCDIVAITSIAKDNGFKMITAYQKKVLWEENFIYTIE